MKEARGRFEEACRQNFNGNNEQRDLQRFLKKHGLSRHTGTLMPPVGPIQRRFKLKCKPEQEADTLMQLAHEYEARGEYVKARDALHDLYMFDPSQSGVFIRARAIEQSRVFQQQFSTLINERRAALQLQN